MGRSLVAGHYQAAPKPTYTYTFNDLALAARVDVLPFEPVQVAVQAGTALRVTVAPKQLTVQLLDKQGQVLSTQTAAPSAARLARQQQDDQVLAGVPFCQPLPLASHPVLSHPRK